MADRVFKWIVMGVACGFIALVFVLIGLLAWQSWPALHQLGPSFFFTASFDPVRSVFGMLPLIYGTIVTSALALIIGAPLGIGVALFLVELAPQKISRIIGFFVEILAAIPSVIFGLWGIVYLVPLLRDHLEPWAIDHFGAISLFRGPPYGMGMLAAGLILAIMIMPMIAAITRDVLRAVPREQREAAIALGATRWEVVRCAVLTTARSGILGAVLLGLGRALGETMAVTMVIGNSTTLSASLFSPAHTMASAIANEFTEATSDIYMSALMGVGFTLLMVTLVVNMVARWLVNRIAKSV